MKKKKKYLLQSGKLVMKLFDKIKEIVEHKQSLVCVLVDEVESIAFARNAVGCKFPDIFQFFFYFN